MAIDLSRFKVIHGERVLNAVALIDARMKEDVPHDYEHRETVMKPSGLMCWQSMRTETLFRLQMKHGHFSLFRLLEKDR